MVKSIKLNIITVNHNLLKLVKVIDTLFELGFAVIYFTYTTSKQRINYLGLDRMMLSQVTYVSA